MNTKYSVVLVANKKYQRYLTRMLKVLAKFPYDVYVISNEEVDVFQKATLVSIAPFYEKMELQRAYQKNNVIHDALFKLFIPYCQELSRYEKVVYIDLDTTLKPGWDEIFQQSQNKYVLATIDRNMRSTDGLACFKYLKGKTFEYANAGVMLFDNSKRAEFPSLDVMKHWIDLSFKEDFLYVDQDILNSMGIFDYTLNEKFNCFRYRTAVIADARIVHYAAEVGVKDIFNRIVDEDELHTS